MRTLSPGLRNHLDGEAITLCHCWQIHRADGVVLGFTDHDRDIGFDGIVHHARSGFEPGDAELPATLSPANSEIAGALSSGDITAEDIAARKYDDARVIEYMVNWSDPDERVRLQTWIIGEIVQEDGAFRAELRSIAALLERAGLNRFERLCGAELGDGRCGIDLGADFSDAATIATLQQPEAENRLLLTLSSLPDHEDGWYAGGGITFDAGANAGLAIEIVTDRRVAGGLRSVELWSVPGYAVQTGEGVTLTPGCDKRFATCREKFANGDNFRGFPHMPTAEFITTYASNAKQMDGGALFVDE
ncbi:MAG: DUF2163 domain-containing protein [Nitratireductor sp.]|nr:DUF2163 domain-containing protein [Nitratireductor sp.]